MQIEQEEVELMQKCFSAPQCRIQNLEMEELEVTDKSKGTDNSKRLIEAVMCLKRLFTFDFS